MHIELPDLDIGRCNNTRQHRHFDGFVETLRCLDYEHTQHVCTFPKPTHVVVSADQAATTYTPPKPKPWVKPDA